MRVEEVSFKVKSDMPLLRVSKKYGNTKILKWSLMKRDLIHVSPEDKSALDEIIEFYSSKNSVIATSINSVSGSTLITDCRCAIENDILVLIEENYHMAITPVVILDGWAHYRIISFDSERLKKLFAEIANIGEVQLESRKKVALDTRAQIWIDTFFNELTVKQMDSLIKAHDNRYYGFPRGAKTDSIAMSMGMSRQTYEEHLRKAESRIIDAVVPYLKMYKTSLSQKKDGLAEDNLERMTSAPIYCAIAQRYLEGMELPKDFEYHSQKAEESTKSFNFLESVDALEACLKILHEKGSDRSIDNVQDLEGDIYWKLARVSAFIDEQDAEGYASKAIEIFQTTGDYQRVIEISTMMAYKTDKLEYYYDLVKNIPETEDNIGNITHFYIHYAKALADHFGEFLKAFQMATETEERIRLHELDFLLAENMYLKASVAPIKSKNDKLSILDGLRGASELAIARFKLDMGTMGARIVPEDILCYMGESYFWLMCDMRKANQKLEQAVNLCRDHKRTFDVDIINAMQNYIITLNSRGTDAAASFSQENLPKISTYNQGYNRDVLSAYLKAVLAWDHVVKGEGEAALKDIADIRNLHRDDFRILYQLPLILMHIEQGETDEAREVLKEAMGFLDSKPLQVYTAMYSAYVNLFALENSILVGDLDIATQFLTRLKEIERIMGENWTKALRLRGDALVKTARKDYLGAVKLLRQASKIWKGLGMEFWQGRDLLSLSSILSKIRDFLGSVSALNRAIKLFTHHGASYFVEKALSEKRMIVGLS